MKRNAAVGLFTKPSKLKSAGYGIFLTTSKVLDARRRGAIEGNAADDALMVDQGFPKALTGKTEEYNMIAHGGDYP
jgi:hypothetical protein